MIRHFIIWLNTGDNSFNTTAVVSVLTYLAMIVIFA